MPYSTAQRSTKIRVPIKRYLGGGVINIVFSLAAMAQSVK